MLFKSKLSELFWPIRMSMGAFEVDSDSGMSTAIEAASVSRRMRNWGMISSGPNTLIEESVSTVRQRSQHSYRNNPTATTIIDTLVSNMVGRGITPRWATGDKTLDKEILALWNLSMSEMDFDSVYDFAGLEALVARTFLLSGDSLCQLKYLSSGKSSLIVPFQVKVMEADQLYEDFNGLLENGNLLHMGIESSSITGQVVAYLLYKYHPGEHSISPYADPTATVRVPASDLLHVYRPLRPGQRRGWPHIVNILTILKSIDEFEDAALDTQKTAAMFSAFIEKPDPSAVDPGIEGEEVQYGNDTYLGLEPGSITTLLRGEKISFATPPSFSNAYEPWIRNQLRRIAAGAGITYEQLTGDLTSVNYSSIRAGLLEFQRRCRMLQFQTLVHQFCRPFARSWLDQAVISRAIRIPRYLKYRPLITNTIWDPDGWDWVSPMDEVKAKQLAVQCGFTSRSRVVGETGANSEVIDAETAEDNSRADTANIVYQSDGRQAGKPASNGTGEEDMVQNSPKSKPKPKQSNSQD